MSPETIEFHLARVFLKLELSSRTELVKRFAAGQLQLAGKPRSGRRLTNWGRRALSVLPRV